LEVNLWENITLSASIFYNLKDLVWYNLEHLPNDGEPKGISNLRYLGTKFPNLIYCCNDSNIIKYSTAKELLKELEVINRNWNKDWPYVTLYSKSGTDWQGGENPSPVIIYDARTESPTKYGYNTHYGNILGTDGNLIKKYDINTVLCSINDSIGEYLSGSILYNMLIQLTQVCRNAVKNNRDIIVTLD
jgi:hypothetical protein